MAQVVHGKMEPIELAVMCLLAEGHLLIEDVPGVGKTSLAKALAASIDCTWKRVQFTPDLLPADLVGVSIYERSTEQFRFQQGPLFANIVLADEINRASPKTQSALLEAMEERQITVDGETRLLPPPFMVIATQNPVDQEGTYRLPESQLDRFLLRISLGYPGRAAEMAILDGRGAIDSLPKLSPGRVGRRGDDDDRGRARRCSSPTRSSRTWSTSPRPAAATRRSSSACRRGPRCSWRRRARAHAAARGRRYATPDDVKSDGRVRRSATVSCCAPIEAPDSTRTTPSARSSPTSPCRPRAEVVAVHARPTRQGITLLAAGVLAIVIGRLFGILELFVIGAALLLSTILAVALVAAAPAAGRGRPLDPAVGPDGRRRRPRRGARASGRRPHVAAVRARRAGRYRAARRG